MVPDPHRPRRPRCHAPRQSGLRVARDGLDARQPARAGRVGRVLPRRAAAAPAVRDREAALARPPPHRRRFHAAAADARAGAIGDRPAVPGLPAHARPLSLPAQPLRRDAARRRGAALRRSPAFACEPAPGAPPHSRSVRSTPRVRDRQRIPARGAQDRLPARLRPHGRAVRRWGRCGEARAIARALGPRVRRGVQGPGGADRSGAGRARPRSAPRSLCGLPRPSRFRVRLLSGRPDDGTGDALPGPLERGGVAARPARIRLSAWPRHAAVHALFPRRRLAARPARQRGDAAWQDLRRGAPVRRSRVAAGAGTRRLRAMRHLRPGLLGGSLGALPRQSGPAALAQAHCHRCDGQRPAVAVRRRCQWDRRIARRRRRFPLHRLRPLHPPLPRGARPRGPVDGRARRPRRRRPSGSRPNGCRHGRRWRGPRTWRQVPGSLHSPVRMPFRRRCRPTAAPSPAACNARPAPTCARSWRTASTAATAST